MTFSFRQIIREEIQTLVERINLLEQRMNTVTMVENPEMEAKLARVRDEPTDFVRIGDLRQVFAQLLHSDPEAILQVKDVRRAMSVLEVIESDMKRGAQPIRVKYRLCQGCNGDGRVHDGRMPGTIIDCLICGGSGRAPITEADVTHEPLERFRAARVEPPNDPCEVWRHRVAEAINLLRGWIQNHESTNAVKPVNATRAYLGMVDPTPEPEVVDDQKDWRALYEKGFAHATKLGADLAKADNALVDALDFIRHIRESDLDDDEVIKRKLLLAKYDKPEAT